MSDKAFFANLPFRLQPSSAPSLTCHTPQPNIPKRCRAGCSQVPARLTMLAKNKRLDEFPGFLVHQALAVVLCPIASFLIVLVVGWAAFHLSASLYALLFRSLFSPFYWGAAVLIGFGFNRRMRHHSACWVWVLPVLAVSLLVIRYSVPAGEYYEGLLVCRDECIAAMFLTLPSMNCIAYSLGGWFALRSRYSVDGATQAK